MAWVRSISLRVGCLPGVFQAVVPSSRREDLGVGKLRVKVNAPRRHLASESDLVAW